MTKPSLRLIALIALEGIGVLVAICAALAGYMLWRAEQGPVSLDMFRPGVERLVARRLPEDYGLTVGAITIEATRSHHFESGHFESGQPDSTRLKFTKLKRPPPRSSYTLTLHDVVLTGARDLSTIKVPRARLTIDKARLLRAGTSLRAVDIPGARIQVERSLPDVETTDIPLKDGGTAASSPLEFIRNLKTNKVLNNGLDIIRINNIAIDFTDQRTQQFWSGKDGSFIYQRGEQASFELSGAIDLHTDHGPASLSINVAHMTGSQPDAPSVSTIIRLDADTVPLGDIASLVLRDNKSEFTAPISGSVALDLDQDENIADIRFDLQSEDGKFLVDESYMPITALVLRGGYNQQSDIIDLKEFAFDIGTSSGALTGTVEVLSEAEGGFHGVGFDLVGEDGHVDTQGFFKLPIKIDRLIAQGSYIFANRQLTFSHIDLQTGDIGLEGSLTLERPFWPDGIQRSPGIYADLQTRGRINHNRLMELWPFRLSPLSRDWVRTRIKKGYTENLVFSMNLAPGQHTQIGYIPDEALRLTFDVGNATAVIIPGMTPLNGAYGRGLLLGNSLSVDIDRGRAGNVAMRDGRIVMPKFTPRDVAHEYSFKAIGDARDMLSLINEKPLSLLGSSGLNPDQISGAASIDMTINRTAQAPGKDALFGFDGTARFEDLTVLEAWGDLDLTSANGTLRLLSDGLEIKGDAKLGATPVNLSWRQNFTDTVLPSQLTLAGTFDAATADLLGIPTRSFLSGPVDIAIDARGRFRTFKIIQIEVDFSDAELRLEEYGWLKPEGDLASLSLDVQYGDDKSQSGSVTISGAGLDVAGIYNLFPDGRLSSLKIPKFHVAGFADFAMEAERERGEALEASVSGGYINLGPVIERAFSRPRQSAQSAGQSAGQQGENEPGHIDWGRGIKARLRFDQLELRNGVALSDAALDLWHDSARLQVLNLTGFDRSSRPVSVNLSNGEDIFDAPDIATAIKPGQRIIRAQTTDIGDLMDGIFSMKSLRGGEGVLQLVLADEPGAKLSGVLEARNVQVVNAPMLAKLFSAGSLEALANLMSDKGIALETVITEFDIADGAITIKDANATGPSVGLSASGTIDLDGSAVALSGALAPVYQLNALLGNTPLIGNLLVNRKGEGFLALAYEISGEVSAPQVTIKPLSALAPGVFRRAFEPEDKVEREDQ